MAKNEKTEIVETNTKENKKELNLKNDVVFKAFFSRKGNEKFLIDFLESLLETKIENIEIEDGKAAIKLNLQKVVDDLDRRKNIVMRRLYKRVRRLKKAFPAINSKEITKILNEKIEKMKKSKKEDKN